MVERTDGLAARLRVLARLCPGCGLTVNLKVSVSSSEKQTLLRIKLDKKYQEWCPENGTPGNRDFCLFCSQLGDPASGTVPGPECSVNELTVKAACSRLYGTCSQLQVYSAHCIHCISVYGQVKKNPCVLAKCQCPRLKNVPLGTSVQGHNTPHPEGGDTRQQILGSAAS